MAEAAEVKVEMVPPSTGTAPASGRESVNLFAHSSRLLVQRAVRDGLNRTSGTGTDSSKLLGTLKGVYLPTTQNILGVILFLRLPFIAAQAGTLQASLIVLLCICTTIPTALSMSAIATNGRIPAGGPYYVVSRNLGPAYGGAIGILFYLGTALAATLYILGAIEAFQSSFDLKDQFGFDTQLEAIGLAFVMTLVVYLGVEYVNKVAFFFLFMVVLSILCAMIGIILFGFKVDFGWSSSLIPSTGPGENFGSSFEEDPDTGLTPSFTSLIALFYPSVTGIMAGANRSGLLRDPSVSIPKGTLGAILTTSILYLMTIWLFGSLVSNETLKLEKFIVAELAWPVPLIVQLGVLMSSVGAGLQSLVGAPQLLQTIVEDGVFPCLSFLEKSSKEEQRETAKIKETRKAVAEAAAKEPQDSEKGPASLDDLSLAHQEVDVATEKPQGAGAKAIWLTFVLAALPCLAGNLDFITPFVTAFFLMMYAAVNFACFILTIIKSPNFRPTFKYFHWSTCLFGTLICSVLMFVAVVWWQAIIVVFIAIGLYKLVEHYSKKSANTWGDWGDALAGVHLEQARSSLLSLRNKPVHPKNWRPQVLVLSRLSADGSPEKPSLLALAGQLKHGKGLTLVVSARQGNVVSSTSDRDEAVHSQRSLERWLESIGLDAFVEVYICDDELACLQNVVQGAGLGALEPNSVLVAWPTTWRSNPGQTRRYVTLLKSVKNIGKSLIVTKNTSKFPIVFPEKPFTGTIDIWWFVHDGGLLLLLPYLLTRSEMWRLCRLRLFSVDQAGKRPPGHQANLVEYLRQLRIDAEVICVELPTEISRAVVMSRTLDLMTRRELLQQYEAVTMTLVQNSEEGKQLAAAARTAQKRANVPVAAEEAPAKRSPSTSDADASGLLGLFAAPTAEELAAEASGGHASAASGAGAGAGAPAGAGAGASSISDATATATTATTAAPSSAAAVAAADGVVAPVAAEAASRLSELADVESGAAKEGADDAAAAVTAAASAAGMAASEAAGKEMPISPDEGVSAAVQVNQMIKERSFASNLIVMNLPLTSTSSPADFMEYVEAMTEGLERVLLVRGSGQEIVTGFA